jgi:hypothetical protein
MAFFLKRRQNLYHSLRKRNRDYNLALQRLLKPGTNPIINKTKEQLGCRTLPATSTAKKPAPWQPMAKLHLEVHVTDQYLNAGKFPLLNIVAVDAGSVNDSKSIAPSSTTTFDERFFNQTDIHTVIKPKRHFQKC